MQESVDPQALVFSTDNPQDFELHARTLIAQIARDADYFLPIASFSAFRQRCQYTLEARPSRKCAALSSYSASESVREVVSQLLEATLRAEAALGTALELTLETVFVLGNKVVLSPLAPRAEGSVSSLGLYSILNYLLSQASRRGSYEQVIASLQSQCSPSSSAQELLSWWQSVLALSKQSKLQKLNSAIAEDKWDEAREELSRVDIAALQFSVCMHAKCPGLEGGRVWPCDNHVFCSESCLAALQVAKQRSGCPLCTQIVRRVRQKPSSAQPEVKNCPCGLEIRPDSEAWRLSLIGSQRYYQAAKCCSEGCLDRFFPETQECAEVEKVDEALCVWCSRRLEDVEPTQRYQLNCEIHAFCSIDCYFVFKGQFDNQSRLYKTCHLCCQHLWTEVVHKDMENIYAEELRAVESLQAAFRREPSTDALDRFLNAYQELKALIRSNRQRGDPRPLYVSTQNSYYHDYLLTCCNCCKPMFISIDSSKKRQTLQGAHLLKCEIKVHGVCSRECWEAVSSRADCPACVGFALEADPSWTDPTAECLRRIPHTICWCKDPREWFSLPNCSHEVCRTCLAKTLQEESFSHWYSCFICGENYRQEDLILELCSQNPKQLRIVTWRPVAFSTDCRKSLDDSHTLRISLSRPSTQRCVTRGPTYSLSSVPNAIHVQGKGLLRVPGFPYSLSRAASNRCVNATLQCKRCSRSPCRCRKEPLSLTKKVKTLQVATEKPRDLSAFQREGTLRRAIRGTGRVAFTQKTEENEAEAESYESESEEEDSDEYEDDSSESEEEQSRRPVSPCEQVDPLLRKPENKRVFLVSPLYKGRPATVLFDYPPQCMLPSKVTAQTPAMSAEEMKAKPLYYRYSASAHVYNCVVTALEYNGFQETCEDDFNLYMSGGIRPKVLVGLSEYQKYNHYPGSWQLGRKDNLWRNISRMRRTFGEEYNLCPPTYILPEDFDRFEREKEERPSQLWIFKPVASACGRGIRVLSNKSKVKRRHGYLISQYVSDPYLINGLKHDLRLYVCVTSYDPLRIYLYKEGLVRFATQSYTTAKSSVSQRFIHLTNYAVNREASNYCFNKNSLVDDQGSKWTHSALKRYFSDRGIDPSAVFGRVKDLIVKTIISSEGLLLNSLVQYTTNRSNCFETYGFDVLLDSSLRPWLMEVNVSPSLNNGSPLDKRVKTALMADIFTMVGFVPYDRREWLEETETKRQDRLLGLNKVKRKRPPLLSLHTPFTLDSLDLSQPELEMLMETEEELHRCGHFERLFPTKDAIPKYAKFIQTHRVNNLLTWKMIMEEPDFLRKYSNSGQCG